MTIELSADARQRLDQHLDAVEQALIAAGRPRDQRRAVVDDLETQILDMLAKKSEAPTLADVAAVLATMDPPAAYGDAAPAAVSTPPVPAAPAPRPRYSRTAIAGLVCILVSMMITLPMLVLILPLFAQATVPQTRQAEVTVPTNEFQRDPNTGDMRQTVIHMAPAAGLRQGRSVGIGGVGLCALILIGPLGIAATALGWIAFAQIRRSNGMIQGKGLALFDGLFYPGLLMLFVIVGLVRGFDR